MKAINRKNRTLYCCDLFHNNTYRNREEIFFELIDHGAEWISKVNFGPRWLFKESLNNH